MTRSFAREFTGAGSVPQTKDDGACAWLAIDWDVRERSAAIVALVDPRLARQLAALPPITSSAALAEARSTFRALLPDLQAIDQSAQVESGWTPALPNAQAIVTTLCEATWAAMADSGHGQAWTATNRHVTFPDTFRPSEVTRLTRLASRAKTWQVSGQSAIADLAAFQPASLQPVFAGALAAIRDSRARLVATF